MTSAVAPTEDDAAAIAEAVVVRLGDGRFAADLSRVAEVGRVPALTRVPGAPGWLAGVANWRGRVLPVLDVRELLGAAREPLGPRARLLVVTVDAMTVGLLVDEIEGTTRLDTAGDPLPSGLPAQAAELLVGQVPYDDGPVAVLDVPAVLRLRDGLRGHGV